MKLHHEFFLKCVLYLTAVLPLAILTALPAFSQALTPVIVSSSGYINATPLTAHTQQRHSTQSVPPPW